MDPYYLFWGLFAGFIYGGLGYLRNRSDGEKFKIGKMLPDVIIGGIAGLIYGTQKGAIPDQSGIREVTAMLVALGVDKYVKTFIQVLLKKFRSD